MRRLFVSLSVLLAGLASSSRPTLAQAFNSGSTGADGAFSPTSSVTVTLPASGVFNYTTVNIPSGVTVRYTRNAGNTPVTILASDNVTIAGTIDISGAAGGAGGNSTSLGSNAGIGGPGGFDGGRGANGIVSPTGGTGLGPGGGGGGTGAVSSGAGAGGGFAVNGGNGGGGSTPAIGGTAYGAAALLPIIGGSGGGGGGASLGNTGGGGGGGGGAIVIASSGTITLTGSIVVLGGGGYGGFGAPGTTSGGGSGGAVRLVATTITGAGTIDVRGGNGGANNGSVVAGGSGSPGRIRIEAFTNTANFSVAGVAPSVASPTSATLANAPTLQITSVAGVAAPATPGASFASPDITLPAGTTNPVSVALSGANIPPGSPVTVRVQGQVGSVTTTSTALAGTQTSTSATASVTIPTNQPSVISATTSFTITAAAGGGPLFVEGEPVERVRVSASFGGATQVAYITKSGREVVVGPVR